MVPPFQAIHTVSWTVASLRLVSPYFFPVKRRPFSIVIVLYKVMTFAAIISSPLPPSPPPTSFVQYVLCKFRLQKFNFIRVLPLWMVSPWAAPPSDATGLEHECSKLEFNPASNGQPLHAFLSAWVSCARDQSGCCILYWVLTVRY